MDEECNEQEMTLLEVRVHYSKDWFLIRDYMWQILTAFDKAEKAMWSPEMIWNAARTAQLMADIDHPPKQEPTRIHIRGQ